VDCYPVQPGDTLRQDLNKGSFATDCWGKGERDSFLKVLTEGMAGRPFRGRGCGRGGREEEQWGGDSGWWNQGFPPMNQGFPHRSSRPRSVTTLLHRRSKALTWVTHFRTNNRGHSPHNNNMDRVRDRTIFRVRGLGWARTNRRWMK
jgi:hypothetical protein